MGNILLNILAFIGILSFTIFVIAILVGLFMAIRFYQFKQEKNKDLSFEEEHGLLE